MMTGHTVGWLRHPLPSPPIFIPQHSPFPPHLPPSYTRAEPMVPNVWSPDQHRYHLGTC